MRQDLSGASNRVDFREVRRSRAGKRWGGAIECPLAEQQPVCGQIGCEATGESRQAQGLSMGQACARPVSK